MPQWTGPQIGQSPYTFGPPTNLAGYPDWREVSGGGLSEPIHIRVGVASRGGKQHFVITGLLIGGSAPTAVTSKTLRDIRLMDIAAYFVAGYTPETKPTFVIADTEAEVDDALEYILRMPPVSSAVPAKGRAIPVEAIEEFGKYYQAALLKTPRRPVAGAMDLWAEAHPEAPISRTTAHRWLDKLSDIKRQRGEVDQ